MKEIEIIKEKLLEIENICESVNENYWENVFKILLKELFQISNKNELKSYVRKILKLYGGMGSFSDLVLYMNGIPCIDENNRLDYLRNQLYKDLQSIVIH